jgi:hypothetical protein
MADICILLAPPRSGTTVLGESAAQAFGVVWLQEIFHDAYVVPDVASGRMLSESERGSFFSYRCRALRNDAQLSLPSEENQKKIFYGYLEYLRQEFDGKKLIVDIKYNSWHHLNDYWSFVFDPPGLVKIVRDLCIPVVHITRRNLFLQYCSLQHARATGQWHARTQDEVVSQKLVINMAHCERFMGMIETSASLFEGWLGDCIHGRLIYETMFNGVYFDDEVSECFSRIFEAPNGQMESYLIKVTPPVREIISNSQEVLSYFENTRFAELVRSSLKLES